MSEPMSAFVIDTSHWDGVITWPVTARNVAASIHKATEGLDWVDHEFLANKSGSQAEGHPWGAYHYWHPSKDSVAQAAHFVNTVGDGCHIYAVDVETATLTLAGIDRDNVRDLRCISDWMVQNKTLAGIADKLLLMLQRVEALSGKRPVIYTSPGFWKAYFTPAPSWASDYRLWIANYQVYQPTIPSPWSGYWLWQYSDALDVPGVPSVCDGNRYAGSVDAARAEFGNYRVPGVQPMTLGFRSLVYNQRVRTLPNITAPIVCNLVYGETYPADDIYAPGLPGNIWAHLTMPDGKTGWAAIIYGSTAYLKRI